jgi:hypothetical protein
MDLDYDNLSNKRFPQFDIAVLAYVNGKKLRTASNLNIAVGRLRNTDQWADLPISGDGQGMVRLSTAQVYFRKPQQDPNAASAVDEFASLYSPYWQVRLTEPNEAQRAASIAYSN